jgi:putative peptidoglycan lipid II flippase
MVPVFYALNDTRLPVLGSFITVAANLVLINLTLAPLQHRAIALSTSLSMILNFFFLAAMLYRKLQGFQVGYLCRNLAKVTLASVMMGLAVTWAHPLAASWLGKGLGGQILGLMAVITLGLGVYALVAARLKIPEFQELLQHLAARRKK